jgi:hypothetical protein
VPKRAGIRENAASCDDSTGAAEANPRVQGAAGSVLDVRRQGASLYREPCLDMGFLTPRNYMGLETHVITRGQGVGVAPLARILPTSKLTASSKEPMPLASRYPGRRCNWNGPKKSSGESAGWSPRSLATAAVLTA